VELSAEDVPAVHGTWPQNSILGSNRPQDRSFFALRQTTPRDW